MPAQSNAVIREEIPGQPRQKTVAEILIVLGLSFGASAVYAVVAILNRATREQPIGEQTAALNRALDEREVFDLVYQLLAVFFDLVPVALVVFLLWRTASPRLGRLGIDFTRPERDAGWALVLALAIGIPGAAVYFVGRALGFTPNVTVAPEDWYWWTAIVLVLRAATAGITEEVIVIGYLFARLRDLGWSTWAIIVSSAALRGTYHLYQGVPAFFGNVAMGILFGWLYTKTGRVLPFVLAHFAIDAVIFIGYPLAVQAFPEIFGFPATH